MVQNLLQRQEHSRKEPLDVWQFVWSSPRAGSRGSRAQVGDRALGQAGCQTLGKLQPLSGLHVPI